MTSCTWCNSFLLEVRRLEDLINHCPSKGNSHLINEQVLGSNLASYKLGVAHKQINWSWFIDTSNLSWIPRIMQSMSRASCWFSNTPDFFPVYLEGLFSHNTYLVHYGSCNPLASLDE